MQEGIRCMYCGKDTKEGNRKFCKACYHKYKLLPRFTEAVRTIKKETNYGRKKGS